MEAGMSAAPGWYVDPYNQTAQRYWDGFAWTQTSQPLQTAPAAPQPQQQVVYVQNVSNGLAVASLVLGIVGFFLGLIPILFIVAWALGVPGFILGIAGIRKANRLGGVRKTMAIWGVVMSVAAFGMGCLGVAIVNDAFNDLDRDLNNASQELDKTAQCIERADTPEEMDRC